MKLSIAATIIMLLIGLTIGCAPKANKYMLSTNELPFPGFEVKDKESLPGKDMIEENLQITFERKSPTCTRGTQEFTDCWDSITEMILIYKTPESAKEACLAHDKKADGGAFEIGKKSPPLIATVASVKNPQGATLGYFLAYCVQNIQVRLFWDSTAKDKSGKGWNTVVFVDYINMADAILKKIEQ